VNLAETESEDIADGEIESKTILDALGIEIQPASDEDIKNNKGYTWRAIWDMGGEFEREDKE
jgi:hypothetical protein